VRFEEIRAKFAAMDLAGSETDPLSLFRSWFKDVIDAGLPEPRACVLGTSLPSMRIMTLKDVTQAGFDFDTSYESEKARQFERNPGCALLFPWQALGRQVRVEGRIVKLDEQRSDLYFSARPRNSQLSAWAWNQSDVLADRDEMERRMSRTVERFPEEVGRPPHWGAYRVVPDVVEFWQARPGMLHDRIRYRCSDGRWRAERLAP